MYGDDTVLPGWAQCNGKGLCKWKRAEEGE